jgi:predicted nucleic-acid-binding Zn-ribbon protein
MVEKKFVCPKCGSEMIYFKTININPKPKGIIGLSMDDLRVVYRCRKCGYKCTEDKMKWDKMSDEFLKLLEAVKQTDNNIRYQDAHRDFEGLDIDG